MIKFNIMGIISSKKGGNHFGKGGGGTDPLSPPPPKSALVDVCVFSKILKRQCAFKNTFIK